ncbi:MAG: YtxH domain-containing protein [Candidatus Margulisiibacteriota bacterium]
MGKWLKGVFAGGLIGLVAGLLYAPRKGEDTRKKLQETLEKARKAGADIKGKGEELVGKAKQKINEVLESEIDE